MSSAIVVQNAQELATRLNIHGDPNQLVATLKATAFKGQVSDEQMVALLFVASQHGLNPFTKEIYAFPDRQNGIVPVVGVDGWSRIINSHPQFDGIDFTSDEESVTCTIYRKDRSHPIKVTEYLAECKRDGGPWKTHPRRMLRHKAMIQCARVAFGFTGFYDPDEAERIVAGTTTNNTFSPSGVASQQAPDGYEAYEEEHLPALREAAMNGVDALQAAFQSLKAGPHKTAIWQAHGESLKQAANSAQVVEVGVEA